MAENMADYAKAEAFYTTARTLDPADPAPLRYLGELYRHQTGDWDKARAAFQQILDMRADPMSRAVALHGIGKMTIHDGEFQKGLHLMEQSADVFPLPLTYRNLAVYWHSEGDRAKADAYTQKALALDPDEPFNVVFAAAFAAGEGGARAREALQVAQAHEDLLCASYNLAAIHAQLGDRNKALALLKRHFYEYERFDAVRSKEMMEARVDAVFASIVTDPEFVSLTGKADGKLPMPSRRPSVTDQARDPLFAPIPGADTRVVAGVQVDVLPAGSGRIKRVIYQPGFRWSTHMKQAGRYRLVPARARRVHRARPDRRQLCRRRHARVRRAAGGGHRARSRRLGGRRRARRPDRSRLPGGHVGEIRDARSSEAPLTPKSPTTAGPRRPWTRHAIVPSLRRAWSSA